MGFFLISVAPVGMQYVAEVTYPAPEGTSNGLIQFAGQLSVIYVYIMEAMKSPNGAFTYVIGPIRRFAAGAGWGNHSNEGSTRPKYIRSSIHK